MTSLLADLTDINAHLPANVQVNNAVDDSLQIDAFRLIRGQLSAVFDSSLIASWISPDTTPELIRSIAGRLIASKYYADLVAGNAPDEMAAYAVSLYQEAIGMLTDIKAGTVMLVDTNGNLITQDDIGTDPSLDVYPNDQSTPGPQFTMDRVFGSQA